MWALNKNPTDRPGDADQFITALEQAKAAIVARQRGQRTASMAALAGVAAGGGALGAAGADLGPEPPPGDEEPGGDGAGVLVAGEPPPPPGRRRPTRREWALIALLLALLLGGAAAAYLLTRPAQRIVPTVVGEQVNIARTQLQNAGFKVGVINVTSDRPSGTVIGQKPLGASKADQGSTVNLTVSQGPGNTTVPSVVGESQQAAKQTLARARLTVSRVEHEASNTVSAGDATRTEPSAGFSVPVGTGVTLFISSGRPVTLVTVPDVTGQPESSATATLRGQGFHVTTSTQPSANTPSGNVISQDPTGGSRVRPGSTVSLVVSSGAAKATVPDVTGQTAGAARGALSGAGFSVSEQSTDVTDKSKDGVVISQSPPGGSSADPGSTVTIVVGHFKAPPTKPTTSTTTSTSNTTTKP
jgi:serine/threonine-protein kinase